MFRVLSSQGPVVDDASARKSDTVALGRSFHSLLDQKVYLPPAQFEAAFVSAARSEADIDVTIAAAGQALRKL